MHSKDLELFKAPLFQIIAEVVAAKGRQEKVDLLRRYNSPTLKAYLSYLFDPKIKFSGLPASDPRYASMYTRDALDKPDNLFEAHYQLMPHGNERLDRVFFLTDHGRGGLSPLRVYDRFIQTTQVLHPADVPLFVRMINKDPPVGLTRMIIAEAFPVLVTKWAPEVADKPKRGRPSKETAPAPAPAPTPQLPKIASKETAKQEPPQKRGRGRPKGSKNRKKK